MSISTQGRVYIFKCIFFFVNYGDMKLGQLIKFAWCEGVGPKSKPLVINEPIAINSFQPSFVFRICIANQMTVFYMECWAEMSLSKLNYDEHMVLHFLERCTLRRSKLVDISPTRNY